MHVIGTIDETSFASSSCCPAAAEGFATDGR